MKYSTKCSHTDFENAAKFCLLCDDDFDKDYRYANIVDEPNERII